MNCLGCNLIESKPVTLRDGRTVCNACPAWMRECLVRDVAKQPKRAVFLKGYADAHGNAEAQKLADEVRDFLNEEKK